MRAKLWGHIKWKDKVLRDEGSVWTGEVGSIVTEWSVMSLFASVAWKGDVLFGVGSEWTGREG